MTQRSRWVLLLLSLAPAAAQADDMHAYGVADFDEGNSCTGADSHGVHNDTPDDFADVFHELMDEGKWGDVRVRKNTSVRGIHFQDDAKVSGGLDEKDLWGADEPDVFFIHTHGSHDSNGSKIMMGNKGYTCKIRTDSHMRLDHDLDIAVVKACQSGDYKVWKNGKYNTLWTSGSQFTMWNAFHGNSSCGFWTGWSVSDYAWDSQKDGVGENWLDEFYTEWLGSENDDCPVSIVKGSSAAKRDAQFENGGWRDRKDTGTKSGSTYYYVGDCAPEKGVQLPDPS
jgi:hypothetical protein